MEYQSFGRPQRPKGANIKQALKVMLVLAVGAWLVYQIKHSIWNKTENYGVQTNLVARDDATILLGRNGIPSRFDGRAFPDSGNEDSSAGEGKESSSDSNDVFDEAKKLDKAEEEFGHVNEKLRENEEKEVELEPEKQPKEVSSKNKYKDSSKEKSGKVYVESRRNGSGDKVQVINDPQSNDKETEMQLREPQNDVQVRKNAKSDLSRKENDEESATNAVVTEGIDEVKTFHDETGVLPDCNETEVVGQAHIMHEENISDFSKGSSSIGKGNIFEVTSGEDNNVEVTLEGTKNDATAIGEINTATITHVDSSGINLNSEINQGDGIPL